MNARACLFLACLGTATGDLIETKVLDPNQTMVIEVGSRTATSLLFPDTISSIAGYGLTEGEEPGTYHYAHDAEHNLLLLRNVMPDKHCFMTVLMGDALYVFDLRPSPTPMIAVTLERSGAASAREVSRQAILDRRLDHTPERLLHLMKLAKHERVFAPMLPDTYEKMESRAVVYRREYGSMVTQISMVSRFRNYDAFVFSGSIANHGPTGRRIDTSKLRILVGKYLLPAAAIQMSDTIAPGGVALFQCVTVGDGQGGRAHLSVDNEFYLLLPPEETPVPVVVPAKPVTRKVP